MLMAQKPYDELTEWLRAGDVARPLSRAAVEEARRNRVHLLVAYRAGQADRASDLDSIEGFDELARELRTAAVVEALRARELQRVLDAVAGRGGSVLLFKGAALACSVYPE